LFLSSLFCQTPWNSVCDSTPTRKIHHLTVTNVLITPGLEMGRGGQKLVAFNIFRKGVEAGHSSAVTTILITPEHAAGGI